MKVGKVDVTPDPAAKPLTGGVLFCAGATFDFHGVAVSLVVGVARSLLAGFPRQLLPASGVSALELARGTLELSAGSPRNPEPRGIPSFVSAATRS